MNVVQEVWVRFASPKWQSELRHTEYRPHDSTLAIYGPCKEDLQSLFITRAWGASCFVNP
jgi:hypothetical protein